jgi:hypothetical protein
MSSDENRLRQSSLKDEQDVDSFMRSEEGAMSFSNDQQGGGTLIDCPTSPPLIESPTATSGDVCALMDTWLDFCLDKLSDKLIKYNSPVSKERPLRDYMNMHAQGQARPNEVERLRAKFNLSESEGENILENLKLFLRIYERCGNAPPDNFLGVKDKDGVLQSAAYFEIEHGGINVKHVATAPWNLFKGDARTVKGAGSALMQEFIQRKRNSANPQLTLGLVETDYSRGFYEKLGFTKGGSGMIYES